MTAPDPLFFTVSDELKLLWGSYPYKKQIKINARMQSYSDKQRAIKRGALDRTTEKILYSRLPRTAKDVERLDKLFGLSDWLNPAAHKFFKGGSVWRYKYITIEGDSDLITHKLSYYDNDKHVGFALCGKSGNCCFFKRVYTYKKKYKLCDTCRKVWMDGMKSKKEVGGVREQEVSTEPSKE